MAASGRYRRRHSQPAVLTQAPEPPQPRYVFTNVSESEARHWPQHRQNCITVTEQDLRKHGGNLDKLRQCQVPPWHERVHPTKDIPFKDAYEQRCRRPSEIIDPWRDLPNPEKTREFNELDLILNEVCPRSPKKPIVPEFDDFKPQQLEEAAAVQEQVVPRGPRARSSSLQLRSNLRKMASTISNASTAMEDPWGRGSSKGSQLPSKASSRMASNGSTGTFAGSRNASLERNKLFHMTGEAAAGVAASLNRALLQG